MAALLSRLFAWGPDFEGSTRALGIIRIGLALLIWTRLADEVAFFLAENISLVLVGIYFYVFTTMMLLGIYTRVAVPMVALVLAFMFFFFGKLGLRPWEFHHVYLLVASTALLSFTPSGRSYSVDRLRALRQAERDGTLPPVEYSPLWGQRLMCLQLSALYFWTAVDKLNWAFISGQRLEATLLFEFAGLPLEPWVTHPIFVVPASLFVIALEFTLAFTIHVRRLQPIVLPLGILMHIAFFLLVPVYTFSLTMILLYLAVLDPNVVHRFLDRIQGHAPTPRHL